MGYLLDEKAVAAELKENIRSEVSFLRERKGVIPHLAMIVIGENATSKAYIQNKEQVCKEVGIHSTVIELPKNVTEQKLIQEIQILNNSPKITGILVQLPLPAHIQTYTVIQAINPTKDINGFHPINIGRLSLGLNGVVPYVPMGILTLLQHKKIDLAGKHIVIIGQREIIGKPMAQLCLNQQATVTICHSKTKELKKLTTQADILIVATGRPQFITADMVKDGSIVIDAGINRLESGELVGDVDFEHVKPKTSYITSFPGCLEMMSDIALLSNTLKCLHLT